ncbi:MAG: ankyrin repeat domain-containing protein [Bacteroidota bacterium]
MLVVLVKASLVIAVLLGFYKLVLERESFFAANRLYLLACLLLACGLPFVSLPQLVNHQGWLSEVFEIEAQESAVEPLPTPIMDIRPIPAPSPIGEAEIWLEEKAEVEEISESQALPSVIPAPKPLAGSPSAAMDFSFWLLMLYLFGVLVLTLNLLAQIVGTFWRIAKTEDIIEDADGIIVNLEGEVAPCSFFQYIFINPIQYNYDTYEQILAHEKIHVRQKHTLDLLLAEVALIVLWFNPFVWLLRKEVEKNIEYQTDDLLLRNAAETKENYQLNLVKIASGTKPLNITTNYNQSLIKQRILKMNSKKSQQYSYWKYAFVAPLVFGLALFLNKPSVSYAPINAPFAAPVQMLDNLLMPITLNEGSRVEEDMFRESSANPITARETDANALIRRGADVSLQNEDQGSAPSTAARNGHNEIVKLLLNSGAYVDGQASTLSAAARNDQLPTLDLSKRWAVSPKLHKDDPEAALIAAAREGDISLIKRLVANGADIDAQTNAQGSALNAAARKGHAEVVRLLLALGADPNVQNNSQGSPLNAAARYGHNEIVRILLANGADINAQTNGQGSALNAAVRHGKAETVKILLSSGANPNVQNSGQGSPLNAAVRREQYELIPLLVANGADINAQTNGQGSALNAAARKGQVEAVKLLLALGANPNIQNNGLGSPLNAAARHGHNQVVKILLANGANINAQTNGQGSALNAAARHGYVETVKVLLRAGADPNVNNNSLGSPLNAAARHGHNQIVKILLANGADINAQTLGHGSALNAAARHGYLETVKILLSAGADPNVQNKSHGSPLNAAARHGEMNIIKLLVANGADINQRSRAHGTAIEAAERKGHMEIARYLKSKRSRRRQAY